MRFFSKFDDDIHQRLIILGFKHRIIKTMCQLDAVIAFEYTIFIDNTLYEIKYRHNKDNAISFTINGTEDRFIHIGIDNKFESYLFSAIYRLIPQLKNISSSNIKSFDSGWTEITNMQWQKNNGFNTLKIKFNAGKKQFELYANNSLIISGDDVIKLMEYAKDNFKC